MLPRALLQAVLHEQTDRLLTACVGEPDLGTADREEVGFRVPLAAVHGEPTTTMSHKRHPEQLHEIEHQRIGGTAQRVERSRACRLPEPEARTARITASVAAGHNTVAQKCIESIQRRPAIAARFRAAASSGTCSPEQTAQRPRSSADRGRPLVAAQKLCRDRRHSASLPQAIPECRTVAGTHISRASRCRRVARHWSR